MYQFLGPGEGKHAQESKQSLSLISEHSVHDCMDNEIDKIERGRIEKFAM